MMVVTSHEEVKETLPAAYGLISPLERDDALL